MIPEWHDLYRLICKMKGHRWGTSKIGPKQAYSVSICKRCGKQWRIYLKHNPEPKEYYSEMTNRGCDLPDKVEGEK